MSVSDSQYFTLNSITTAIGDKNDAVNQAKWSATAKDFDNGESVAAGVWTTYVYTVNDSIPDGTYTALFTTDGSMS